MIRGNWSDKVMLRAEYELYITGASSLRLTWI